MQEQAAERFGAWSAPLRLAALLALAALMLLAAAVPPARTGAEAPGASTTLDRVLYQRIIDGVAAGEDYYAVAVREHRRGNFPLKPFVTVRPPALAWLSAALGPAGTRAAMALLAATAAIAWLVRLRGEGVAGLLAAGLTGLSCLLFAEPLLLLFHDCWAGVLMALALGLRAPGRWGAAVAAGLAAALLREMAAGVLVLMLACAVIEKQWRESAGWAAALAVFAAFMAWHALALGRLVLPGDSPSPGWDGLGGWGFYAASMAHSSLLTLLPPEWGRALVPLCLFGWLSLGSAAGLRAAGLLGGLALAVMLFARAENFYWCLMSAPLLVAGIAFAPAGVWGLARGLRPERIAVAQSKMPAA